MSLEITPTSTPPATAIPAQKQGIAGTDRRLRALPRKVVGSRRGLGKFPQWFAGSNTWLGTSPHWLLGPRQTFRHSLAPDTQSPLAQAFATLDFPTLLLTDTAKLRQPNSGTPQDLPEPLDMVKFTEAVRGIDGMLESLAQ